MEVAEKDFRVLDKKENYVVVEFFEPIGKVVCVGKNGDENELTVGAKVYVNDFYEVLIVPFKVPNELW